MSILSKITSGQKGRAQKSVIYAPEGFGKSTLASQFPSPLFLDVEDSTSQLDVRRLSRAELPDLKAFEAALAEIAKAKPCATLVVDTIDWLEQMAEADIIAAANNPKITGIEDFGYGKGYIALRERMTILLVRFDALINAGINVMLLAHSKVNKFEPPDGAGPFDRYELKLSKHVSPLVKEWADMVLFGNWRTQVAERDKNEAGAKFKGVGGKERLMHCNRTAAWDAKNRHRMADVEKWEIGVIQKAFQAVGAPWVDVVGKPVEPVAEAMLPPMVVKDSPAPAPAAPEVVRVVVAGTDVDPELAKICEPRAAAVTAYLLASARIHPGETWANMPADFAARVKKNPAGFLRQVDLAAAAKGQEVAA